MKRSAPDLIQTIGSLAGLRTTASAGSTMPLMRSFERRDHRAPAGRSRAARPRPACRRRTAKVSGSTPSRSERAAPSKLQASPLARPAAMRPPMLAASAGVGGHGLDQQPRGIDHLEQHVARLDHLARRRTSARAITPTPGRSAPRARPGWRRCCARARPGSAASARAASISLRGTVPSSDSRRCTRCSASCRCARSSASCACWLAQRIGLGVMAHIGQHLARASRPGPATGKPFGPGSMRPPCGPAHGRRRSGP